MCAACEHQKIHDIIRCALNQAIRWEYIDTSKRNPASLATLPKVPKVRRKVWSIQTFRQAVQAAEDDLLSLCMHLAFSCSMRIGEITGLTWEDVIIDEESIATDNARVIINKELSRVNAAAMQKLKEKDIIKIFPTQKPHCTTRLVLKTPKRKPVTELSGCLEPLHNYWYSTKRPAGIKGISR